MTDRKRDNMLSGYPGTRWTRFRSPEKPGYPAASPSPTSRIWRVPFRGGYQAGGTSSLKQPVAIIQREEHTYEASSWKIEV